MPQAPTDDLDTSTLEVATPDGPMAVYRAAPRAGGNGRGVIVIQEAFGVNGHIEDVTRRFAALGYLAVAPHLFHRTGGGTVDYGKFEDVLPHFAELSDDKLLADVDAARRVLHAAGVSDERTGIVGFCMGGRVSFLVALRRQLGASVGFYGGGIVSTRFEQMPALAPEIPGLATPWLGLFGDLDQSIPVDDVEELRRLLDEGATVDVEVVRYADAGHGFHCDQRDAYHAESAADGFARTLAWFDGHLD